MVLKRRLSMADILNSLAELAKSVFRARKEVISNVPPSFGDYWADSVLQEAFQSSQLFWSFGLFDFKQVGKLILTDPDFHSIAPHERELDPMLLTPTGGIRIQPDFFVQSLLSSALVQMYFLGLPFEEGTFVSTVLEGIEELRRAVSGKRVHGYNMTAISQISLPEGAEIKTPWGVIRPVTPSSIHPHSTGLIKKTEN
jgi:hypothetical protein